MWIPAAAVGDGLAAYHTQTLEWAACGARGRAECATYLVPLDYGTTQGATLRVGVSRVKATGTRLGSLMFNPGGPGGSGSSWVTSSISAFPKALRRSYDIIGFDARRAKERVFSMREEGQRWEPRRQRPDLWRTANAQLLAGQTMRAFPLSNWTELDVWRYIRREEIPTMSLYFAKPRPTINRNGRPSRPAR